MVAAGMTPLRRSSSRLVTKTFLPSLLSLTSSEQSRRGKSADFIVLDANPLENINNTRRIADVYLRGRKLDRAAMRASFTGK